MPPEFTFLDPVTDILKECVDAPFILEGDEPKGRWLKGLVDLNWIVPEAPWNRAGLPASLNPVPGDEDERMATIASWVEASGGLVWALRQSPPLLGFDGKVLKVIDGWHRLSFAWAEGLIMVPAFVGLDVLQRPKAELVQRVSASDMPEL